jgi:hypothetical protein
VPALRAGPTGSGHRLVHPVDRLGGDPVRGPKNPERAAITARAPKRVIADREENRKLDVTRLREVRLPTW